MCEWVNVSANTGPPGSSQIKGSKTSVYVCVYVNMGD